MSSTQPYDYALIGAGAAGLHLAIKIAEDPFFADKKILILDKDKKVADDRTWSFWEKGESRWDNLAVKTWRKSIFYSKNEKAKLSLGDFTYKTLRSSSFYTYAKDIVKKSRIFTWVEDEVKSINGQDIIGHESAYKASYIFDSRISPEFFEHEKEYTSLTQHFLGWFIETKEPVFDDSEFTVMDYRLQWKDQTSFTYVLPFSPTFALVEFTLFNNIMLERNEYEKKLAYYISHYLKIEDYTIKDIEYGEVPMSNYPFAQHHNGYVSKVGTAGGWVRPSSGYSFKNADRYSQKIIDNIKKGNSPHKGVAKNRFRFYDSIFLRVLHEHNDLGPEIFHTLYAKQSVESLFRFLDEESTLVEDLKIMFSLNQKAFRRALINSF